jgi:hypothetical protein
MNNNKTNIAQCCVDYCTTTFKTGSEQIENSYKCNSKKLSAAEAWKLQKQRKTPVVRNYGM